MSVLLAGSVFWGGDILHMDGLIVPAGQQRRPCRRADRARAEMVEAQTIASNRIDIGSMDLGAKRAKIGKTNVIQDEKDNVGATRRNVLRYGRRIDGGHRAAQRHHRNTRH